MQIAAETERTAIVRMMPMMVVLEMKRIIGFSKRENATAKTKKSLAEFLLFLGSIYQILNF